MFSRRVRGPCARLVRGAQAVRELPNPCQARGMLGNVDVSTKPAIEPWTIPLHIIMWTTLLAGLIMVIVVFLMH